VAATLERLRAALDARGISVFAQIDHAGGARDVGLDMADEQVLIFGDPKAGTGLMQEDPTIGYELPLRVLVWDAGGQTMIGYRAPPELGSAYSVAQHADVLQRMDGLLGQLAAEAAAGAVP
jgi:uncharacterized protein (DUF302 family)